MRLIRSIESTEYRAFTGQSCRLGDLPDWEFEYHSGDPVEGVRIGVESATVEEETVVDGVTMVEVKYDRPVFYRLLAIMCVVAPVTILVAMELVMHWAFDFHTKGSRDDVFQVLVSRLLRCRWENPVIGQERDCWTLPSYHSSLCPWHGFGTEASMPHGPCCNEGC